MAYGADDIERLKAAVPPQYRPSPEAGGQLPEIFRQNNAAMGTLRVPTTLKGRPGDILENHPSPENPFGDLPRHQMGLAFMTGNSDPEAAPGFMLTGAQMAMRTAALIEGEQRKRSEESRFIMDQLRRQLDQRLAELDAELARIDERLDAIGQRRADIGESLEALDELETLQASGQLDPDNPAHAQLLRRAGITPEDARRKDAGDIIARRRGNLGREDDDLEREWNGKMKRRGEIIEERQSVIEARAEIENADTPEAVERAESRARSVLGAQQLGEAALQTQSHQAKVIAADAVARNENEEVRADSQNFDYRAISKDSAAVFQTDNTTFNPDGPASNVAARSVPVPS